MLAPLTWAASSEHRNKMACATSSGCPHRPSGTRAAMLAEIQQTAARHAPLRPEIDKLAAEWDSYDPVIRPPAP